LIFLAFAADLFTRVGILKLDCLFWQWATWHTKGSRPKSDDLDAAYAI
jgi:hypothetical protein